MKVLFYGNCQLGALARQFRLNSSYHLLDCRDFDFVPFWQDEGLFAVWSPDNVGNQNRLKPKILAAVKETDIFIFQHYKTDSNRPQQITTEYLCTQATHALQICLPSFWYNGYMLDDINPVLHLLHQRKKTPTEILKFLKEETAPFVDQLFQERHVKSTNELQKRQDNESVRYVNFVPCLNWIRDNYSTRLIAYSHSHPSFHYYNYVLDALHGLGVSGIPAFSSDSLVPGNSRGFFVDELFYFHQLFPAMEDLADHQKHLPTAVTAESIAKHLDRIAQLDSHAT